MSFLKNTVTGRVVGDIPSSGDVYEFLKGLLVPGTKHALYEDVGRDTVEGLLGSSLEDSTYQVLAKLVGPLAAAADATIQIGVADSSANVTSIEYFPQAGVVGQATNFRTLSVVDATGPVTIGSVALSSAPVVLAANQPNAIAVASAAVVEGDVIQWKSAHTLTGLADPGGLVVVTIAGYTVSAQDYSNPGYIDPFHGGTVAP